VSDRTDAIRRRRDLLVEELARVERQLAAEESVLVDPSFRAEDSDETAERILARYRKPEATVASSAKRSMILVFSFGMAALLALAGLGFVLYMRSLRGH
jgi:hypothetical protein